jgi:MFS family permease
VGTPSPSARPRRPRSRKAVVSPRDHPARGLGRPFWALSSAASISSLGDGAALVGFPLLAASYTRSPILISGVAVALRVPWLLVSLPAGALVDRINARRVLAAVEASRMAVVGLFAVAVAARFHPLAAIYVAAFVLGSFETAFSAGVGALVPRLAADQDLGRANGWLLAGQVTGEQTAGPAVGGLLAGAALALPFAFDGATFAASALILVAFLARGSADATGAATVRRSHIATEVREGLRWLAGNATLRALALYISGLAFAQSAVFAVFVLWALHTLGLSRLGYGLLMTVASVGLIITATLSGRWVDRLGASPLLIWAGLLAAVSYVGLALTTNLVATAAALVVESSAVGMGLVASDTLRQRLIPRELLGRVGNAIRSCIFGAAPLGALAAGALAGATSLKVTFLAAGLLQLALVALVGTRLAHHLRQNGAPSPSGDVTSATKS